MEGMQQTGRKLLGLRSVEKLDDAPTPTRQQSPAIGHSEEARVRATHTEDLLQPEGEAVPRREGVDGGPARERAAKFQLELRDGACHGFRERVTHRPRDGFLGVNLTDAGPLAAEP